MSSSALHKKKDEDLFVVDTAGDDTGKHTPTYTLQNTNQTPQSANASQNYPLAP